MAKIDKRVQAKGKRTWGFAIFDRQINNARN